MNKLTTLLIILFIIAFVTVSVSTISGAERVKILRKYYTPQEYNVLRANIVQKFENRRRTVLNYNDISLWAAVANEEIRKCVTRPQFLNVKTRDANLLNELLDQINDLTKEGCASYQNKNRI